MSDAMTCEFIEFPSGNGDAIQGYLARPTGQSARGGVVVIHHMPGFDRGSREITRRFAAMGYDAVMPNLYWRQAPQATPDDAAALVRAAGGILDGQLIDDVTGAAALLRSLDTANGKVGVIGYCSGGRQAVLAGCNVHVDAVVDCYGAFVTGTPTDEFPLKVTNLVDQLPNLRAPLLGLFGQDDQFPSPEQVAELSQVLSANGKQHQIHAYPRAGHAFFNVDRDSYRVEAALDGWDRIRDFFAHALGA